jgi:hypothetical protein
MKTRECELVLLMEAARISYFTGNTSDLFQISTLIIGGLGIRTASMAQNNMVIPRKETPAGQLNSIIYHILTSK